MKSPLGTITSSEEEQASIKPSRLSVMLAGLLMLGIALGMTLDPSGDKQGVAAGLMAGLMGFTLVNLLVWWWCAQKGLIFASRVMMIAFMLSLGFGLEWWHRPFDDINLTAEEASLTGRVVMAEAMTNNRQRLRVHPDHPSRYWQGNPMADLR